MIRSTKGHSIIEIGIAVFLLVIVGMIVSNVIVINLARNYNDRICHEAIVLAGNAALEGKDTNYVLKSAARSMENCGFGGFFVRHPRITKFTDTIRSDLRLVRIETETKVLIPMPFLVFNKELEADRTLSLVSTYTYKIHNPKKLSNQQKG